MNPFLVKTTTLIGYVFGLVVMGSGFSFIADAYQGPKAYFALGMCVSVLYVALGWTVIIFTYQWRKGELQ